MFKNIPYLPNEYPYQMCLIFSSHFTIIFALLRSRFLYLNEKYKSKYCLSSNRPETLNDLSNVKTWRKYNATHYYINAFLNKQSSNSNLYIICIRLIRYCYNLILICWKYFWILLYKIKQIFETTMIFNDE